MFNRARPDREREGIIGRGIKRRHTDAGTRREKRQEKRISRGKTVSPRSVRAALEDDSSKDTAGPQTYMSEAGFLAHKGLI